MAERLRTSCGDRFRLKAAIVFDSDAKLEHALSVPAPVNAHVITRPKNKGNWKDSGDTCIDRSRYSGIL